MRRFECSLLVVMVFMSAFLVGCFGSDAPDEFYQDLVVLNVSLLELGSSSVTIEWTTSVVADSEIEYGISKLRNESLDSLSGKSRRHLAILSDLSPDTLYYYRFRSGVGDNIDVSEYYTFVTQDDAPPLVYDINISSVTSESAVVSWNTDDDAFCAIDYGEDVLLSLSSNEHSLTLDGLSSNKEYSFVIMARDTYGNDAVSESVSFRTLGNSYGMQLYTYNNSTLIDYGETEILIDGSSGIDLKVSSRIDGNIEAILVTNPNNTASLSEVLGDYAVDKVYSNGELSESDYFSDFILGLSFIDVEMVRRGEVVDCGDISLDFYHPANLLGSVDNNSLVFGFYYGESYVLFIDDLDEETQFELVMSVDIPEVDLLVSFGNEISPLFAKHIGSSFVTVGKYSSIDFDDNGFAEF